MKKSSLLIAFVAVAFNLIAQKVVYNMPQSVNSEHVNITFQKVSSSTSSYYTNYKAENTGEGVLVIDRSKASLVQNKGELHPTSEKYIINPGESKTIYNQFRVKAPVKANADHFNLVLNGITYAEADNKVIETEKMILAEKAIQNFDAFSLKVMEYNVYSDRVYAQIKCSYNGSAKTLGNIDLSKLIVSGGKAEIVKKGDVIFAGKSYSFSMNISPDGEELSVDWNGALSVLKFEDVKCDTIVVKSTTYKEPEPAEKAEANTAIKISAKKEAAAGEDCELSYTDFSTLKKDIETEMNGGGDAVAMANEFLMEKGCISTAQVLDILSVFNLDGAKLKFAKMAYQFTADKKKYHMVVGKLAYVKNKQALEEFLEQQ